MCCRSPGPGTACGAGRVLSWLSAPTRSLYKSPCLTNYKSCRPARSGSATAKNGFKLSTPVQRVSLPLGGHVVIPVLALRQGYQGKIDIAAKLPAGVKLAGATIPEGADGTLVTMERSLSPFDALVTTLRGRSTVGTEQVVSVKGHPL